MKVLLAEPRGFCAGVDRAIEIVERALTLYGAPVYVRHEIVHNKHVVETLKQKGAVFVDELADIPEGAITIFSAHGVSEAVENEAGERGLPTIDATCPLVTKVHKEAIRSEQEGLQIILIGHEGHPEVEGTSGRVKNGVVLVSSEADVATITVKDPAKLAYVTQTTLSVDETKGIIAALKARFPDIKGPDLRDICYATQNRQDVVGKMAGALNVLLVLGAQNSSNSNRLRDLGEEMGVKSYLIHDASEIQAAWFRQEDVVGITAGASAPEVLVQQVVEHLKLGYGATVEPFTGVEENVKFKLPAEVTTKPIQRKIA